MREELHWCLFVKRSYAGKLNFVPAELIIYFVTSMSGSINKPLVCIYVAAASYMWLSTSAWKSRVKKKKGFE